MIKIVMALSRVAVFVGAHRWSDIPRGRDVKAAAADAAAVRARARWATLLLVTVSCASCVSCASGDLLESDRVVMLGLQKAWGVKKWDTKTHVCGWAFRWGWDGVTCTGERVTHLCVPCLVLVVCGICCVNKTTQVTDII